MTAPPTSIIPVTMRKTDGAAPRDPVRPIASWRANHDSSIARIAVHGPRSDWTRRADPFFAAANAPRSPHVAALPTTLSP